MSYKKWNGKGPRELFLRQWGTGGSNSGGVGRKARALKRGHGPVQSKAVKKKTK